MRTIPAWVDKVHDRDKLEQCIYSLCFNPEGSQLIVAAGQRVLVYNANDGSLIQPLKGHEKTVFCVNYAKDGKRFASGSADKNVIIWSSKLEGLLKYSHGDSVQCVEFNPAMQLLASCSCNELILWSPEAKSVGKHKIGGRVLACSWSEDGQLLALGLSTGQVSIRNRNGEEKTKIERPSQTSIWALAWGKHKEDGFDVLCVTDWAQTMSFHSMSGKSAGKERKLGFEALCVRYMEKGELLLVCGCSNLCSLYTKEGVKVASVGDQHNSWLWSAAAHPTSNFIALGCQDGTIAYYQVVFNKVHGLYKERYAYRENLTDVIIQHLLTDQKVRIKCRDLVKKIAIYKNRLAVQLGDRVTVYELYWSDTQGMQYRVKEKIGRKVDCYLLVVCSNHLVLCEERRLQSLTLGGIKEREWELDSAIKFIKVVGGPPSQEGLLTGLANGQVLKIFLDNPFPVNLLKIDYPVKCLDLSPSRRKVAIVDDNQHCLVYNLADKKLIYQELNATSVAWNSCCEDMLCFSGNNLLGIKANGFPVHQQKLQGYVVGFCSSKIFCFFNGSMSSIDVPLSAPMYQYLEKKMFREAYETGCLGVTEGDWRTLGNSALDSLQLEVARLAFVRVKDLLYLDLIHQIKEEQLSGETASLGGLVLAYRRRYKEAARAWARIGRQDLALQMYTQLRMFDQGQEFLSGSWTDKASLLKKKADWAEEIKEPRAAAQIYLAAGEELKAVRIMAEYAWVDMLTELGRKSADEEVLRIVADTLLALNLLDLAAEVFRKLGDEEAVLKVQVLAQDWPPALATAEAHPRYRTTVYLPYARYLAENDNFVLAQKAYQKAGHPEEAFRVVKQLTENAISESRFNDAGYFFWLLASHSLQRAREGEEDMLVKYQEYDKYATIYYAYHSIQRYLEEPFTAYQPESLFNIARFLMQETKLVFPPGVSQFAILYAMSKQAKNLGAYKLAIQVLNKLQTLKIPAKFQEYVEVTSVMVKGKPYLDNEELLVMCYRCSSYNPLLTPQTAPPNTCTNCGQPFLHSFLTFEVLPLVEFKLEEGLSEEEALRLLEGGSGGGFAEEESWREELGAQVQSLRPASTQRLGEEEVLTRSSLRRMDPSDVVICRFPPPLHTKYYRNLLPELQLTVCPHCNKIFHMDDLEMKLLEKDSCPFCRLPPSSHHQPPPSF